MVNTTDDNTYYDRHKPIKSEFIEDFVVGHEDIGVVYDVGCNNGDMSYPLQKKHNMEVHGVDLSDKLSVPEDYDFKQLDIVADNSVFYNDLTIFLSLYHHILGKHSLEVADDIFYQLLLRTKYLIFDCGNLSETGRNHTYWYKEQKKHFKNEIELLDHFNIEYEILGKWSCGGGERNVVVFSKDSFDDRCTILNKYRRRIGSPSQREGLCKLPSKTDNLYYGNIFGQIELNDRIFFSKKHLGRDDDLSELENIKDVYNNTDKSKLIKFYGYSNKYGIIYEWLDKFRYVKKVGLRSLVDVDIIEVDGEQKFIDFHR